MMIITPFPTRLPSNWPHLDRELLNDCHSTTSLSYRLDKSHGPTCNNTEKNEITAFLKLYDSTYFADNFFF